MIVIRVGDDGPQYRGHGPVTIGRDESCDLQLDDPLASRNHVAIRREGHEWVAEDQGSRNGTRIGDPQRPITSAILRAGDALWVGETCLRISFDQTVPDLEPAPLRFTILEPASAAAEIRCTRESVTIGRHPSCDVVIDDPTVSRLHAVVAKTSAGYVINDQKATNAVYIGDPPERITAAVLYDGQIIRLGTARLRVHVPEVGEAPEPPQISEATMMIPAVGARPLAEVIQAQLAKAPLFQGFSEEDWTLFLTAYDRDTELHIEHFAAGEVVCEAEHFDSYFRVVLKGSIEARDPGSGEVLLGHQKGDFFGLMEAKKSLARTTRHVAAEPSQVLCLPRHQIRYVERNAQARALLAARHKEESWRVMAAQMELFDGVSVDTVTDLMQSSEIAFYDKAGIVVIREGEIGESVGIVRDGFLKVVKAQEGGEDRILGYLRTGDIFGETSILDDSPRGASVVTAGKAEVVNVDKAAFRALCDQHPEVVERLAQLDRERVESRPDPALARRLEKLGQGFIQADALLLMDLELCVKCDLCVQACEELHGESRLIRRGIELETPLGTHLAPAACRHCDDPLCMFSCPTGAIRRRPEGEIYIDYDLCTGVGACALACPYDNIQMIETHVFDQAQAKKQRALPGHQFFRPYPDQGLKPQGLLQRLLAFGKVEDPQQAPAAEGAPAGEHEEKRHVPASYPIKCDMCDGLPFMGCVHACPTGAAMRVDPVAAGIVGSAVRKPSPRTAS